MEYLLLQKPTLEKGRKIVSVILCDNKGNMVYTDWKNAKSKDDLVKETKKAEKLFENIK